jgi:uncharacterized protein
MPPVDFRTALERGIDLFNSRKFFEAHEEWEDAWRVEKGDPAYFLHGLIQVAAGFVKLQRGEPRGAAGLLRKGAAKLERFLPGRHGVDLTGLLASVEGWIEVTEGMARAGTTGYDPSSLPRLLLRAAAEESTEPETEDRCAE